MAHFLHYPPPRQSAFDVYNYWLDLPLFECNRNEQYIIYAYINGCAYSTYIHYIFFCVLIPLFSIVSVRFTRTYCAPSCSLFINLCLEILRLSRSQFTIDFPYQFFHIWEQSCIRVSWAPATEAESCLYTLSFLPLLCPASLGPSLSALSHGLSLLHLTFLI